MPVPNGTGRTVIQGTGPGAEIWQTGFWWAPTVTGSIVTLADFKLATASIQPLVSTMWASIRSKIYTSYGYTGIKSYWYTGGTTATFVAQDSVTSSPGTLASSGSPIDTSCVVSIRTANAGRSFRGRMYLPRHEACTPATGLFVTSTSDYSTAVGTMFNSLAFASPGALVRQVSLKLAEATIPTAVICDSLPDVQRRRENRLAKGTINTFNL